MARRPRLDRRQPGSGGLGANWRWIELALAEGVAETARSAVFLAHLGLQVSRPLIRTASRASDPGAVAPEPGALAEVAREELFRFKQSLGRMGIIAGESGAGDGCRRQAGRGPGRSRPSHAGDAFSPCWPAGSAVSEEPARRWPPRAGNAVRSACSSVAWRPPRDARSSKLIRTRSGRSAGGNLSSGSGRRPG